MQLEPHAFLMGVVVQVINVVGVEYRRTPLEAVHLVALLEEQLGEIRAVVSRDSRNHGLGQRSLLVHADRVTASGPHLVLCKASSMLQVSLRGLKVELGPVS